MSFTCCFADEFRPERDGQYQKQIRDTGFRILNANNIERRMTFRFDSENKKKIKFSVSKSSITLYKGILPYFENDDELAAILCREMAYITDAGHGIFRRTSMGFNPRKYEMKSDKKGVDYMVKAGYNPIAMIMILNKLTGEPNTVESYVYKHSGYERMVYIYDYIFQKYPVFISNNEYLNDPVYQNFLYSTKNERKKIRSIHEERVKLIKLKKEKNK